MRNRKRSEKKISVYGEGETLYDDVKVSKSVIICEIYDEPNMLMKMRWTLDGVDSRFTCVMEMDPLSLLEEKSEDSIEVILRRWVGSWVLSCIKSEIEMKRWQ